MLTFGDINPIWGRRWSNVFPISKDYGVLAITGSRLSAYKMFGF